jgi:hypothetical protein
MRIPEGQLLLKVTMDSSCSCVDKLSSPPLTWTDVQGSGKSARHRKRNKGNARPDVTSAPNSRGDHPVNLVRSARPSRASRKHLLRDIDIAKTKCRYRKHPCHHNRQRQQHTTSATHRHVQPTVIERLSINPPHRRGLRLVAARRM